MEESKPNAKKTEPEATGALTDGELTRKEKAKLAKENKSIYISYDDSDNRYGAMTTQLQKYVVKNDKETNYIKRLIQSGNGYLVAMCHSTETRDKLLEHLQRTTTRLSGSNKTPDLTIEPFVATAKNSRPVTWFIPIGATEAGPELLGDILAFWMFHTGELPEVGFQVRMVQIQNNTETAEAAVVWNSAVPLVSKKILIGKDLKAITIQSAKTCKLCGQEHLEAHCMTDNPFKTLSKPKITFVPERLYSSVKVCVRMSKQATRYERYKERGEYEKESPRKAGLKRETAVLGVRDTLYSPLSSDSETKEPSEKRRKVN
ncbi:uncharacterized protein DNG_03952 [Cephalotrichum gorgonifer]|uniref:Uncharacterized protein n=1 Tax=Cephalotrichum gorgonifer TaxID=2041049 RepID=A0AAE8MVZ6_9PEZI|nr:uncharacterized protein DNG_03952 [Cephalotrichum gorgonifer]